ncbi:MAG: short-chain dehydrogenase [Planctomycetota bacterium]|nr:MAG: short-chain dehydrogenase [Planctomycetota bacterium]
MATSLRPISDQVIVITGASSGIGLATARLAAKKGANVLLTARNADALAAVVRDIERAGGDATYIAADVAFRDDMEKVARAAIDYFGRIDTWVNNAGLSIYGKLQEVSEEDHRRLFDVNFWGVVNGSLAALPHLKRRGGALINVGSEVSDVAIPVQAMYSATKHAVKGFTDALRLELQEERAPVSVTLVKPASIDTPFIQHAKNYFQHQPKLPPPVYRPDDVARAILHAASRPTRDIFVGGAGKLFSTLNKFVPGLIDWVNASFMVKEQFTGEPASHAEGALYRPGDDGQERGDSQHMVRHSMYTSAVRHPLMASLLLAAAGAAVAAAINSAQEEA